MNTDHLIERIIDHVDPEELVDLLDLSTEDLINMVDVRIKILSRIDRFDFLMEDEYEE